MVWAEGLWPGIVGFANDASVCCNDCARNRYGETAVYAVIWCKPGYEKYTDHEGNPLNVIFADSEDANGEYCSDCREPLFDEEVTKFEESMKDPEYQHTLSFPTRNDMKIAEKALYPKFWVKDWDTFEPEEDIPTWTLILKTVYELTEEQEKEVLSYAKGDVELNKKIDEAEE